jgi:hypothetical protein
VGQRLREDWVKRDKLRIDAAQGTSSSHMSEKEDADSGRQLRLDEELARTEAARDDCSIAKIRATVALYT